MAAWTRHHDLFELLLANGADVECYTELPPIEAAVATAYGRDMFKSLVSTGAQYDISHTLRLGLLRETRTLLEADPSLANIETDHGLPLNLAVSKPGSYKPSPGLFKLLIRFGADIHAEDRFGLTPLKAARLPGNDKIVLALLDMGVEDDIYGALLARDEDRARAILRADPSQAHPVATWPDRGPTPPIVWAVWSGSSRLVEMLLEHDVVLNLSGNPLGIAIEYGYDEIVRLLLNHGASPECGDCSGWPGVRTGKFWDRVPGGGPAPDDDPPVSVPLYTALRNGRTAAVEMLLEAGADPNSTLTMWSGLQWPARSGDLDTGPVGAEAGRKSGEPLRSACASTRHSTQPGSYGGAARHAWRRRRGGDGLGTRRGEDPADSKRVDAWPPGGAPRDPRSTQAGTRPHPAAAGTAHQCGHRRRRAKPARRATAGT